MLPLGRAEDQASFLLGAPTSYGACDLALLGSAGPSGSWTPCALGAFGDADCAQHTRAACLLGEPLCPPNPVSF